MILYQGRRSKFVLTLFVYTHVYIVNHIPTKQIASRCNGRGGRGEVLHILLILHVLIISFHLVRYKNEGTVLEFIQIILANNNLSFCYVHSILPKYIFIVMY